MCACEDSSLLINMQSPLPCNNIAPRGLNNIRDCINRNKSNQLVVWMWQTYNCQNFQVHLVSTLDKHGFLVHYAPNHHNHDGNMNVVPRISI
jgi:hypothetical protein